MNGKPRFFEAVWRRPMAAALCVLLATGGAHAQVPVDEDGNPYATEVEPLRNGLDVENPALGETAILSVAELETLVGPIALYPDDLLAVVLPASTYPLEIVQAARFLERAEHDSSLEPDADWDDSIVALLNYPDVLRMMNEDIDWTWKLGEAVVGQQADVILAIETFRDRAYAAGNLKSDEYQNITVDDGIIEIDPVDDDVIYVPYYEPTRVVHYSPTPVFHYYPRPCPVYYYPYPRNHYLTSRLFWGVTTAFTIGWATDRLHVYHHSYYGHPYYGYSYYGSFWRRPSIHVYNTYYVKPYPRIRHDRYRQGDFWRPRHRSGARPRTVVTDSGYHRDHRPSDRERYYRDRGSNRLDYGIGNRGRTKATRDATRRDAVRDPNRLNRRRSANTGATTADTSSRRAARGSRDAGTRIDRDAIKFRPRGDGGYSARRSQRVERGAAVPRPTPVQRQRSLSDSGNQLRATSREAVNRSTPRTRRSAAAASSRAANRVTSVDRSRRNQSNVATRVSAPKAVRSQPSRPTRTTQRTSRPSNQTVTKPERRAEGRDSRPGRSSPRSGRNERVRH